LTRKFNIEYTPPSEDKLKAQLIELDKAFKEFEAEKRELIAAQKAKVCASLLLLLIRFGKFLIVWMLLV